MDDFDAEVRAMTKRDNRFLAKLVLGLSLTFFGGLFLASMLTDGRVGDCAARGFGVVTDPGDGSPRPTPAPSDPD